MHDGRIRCVWERKQDFSFPLGDGGVYHFLTYVCSGGEECKSHLRSSYHPPTFIPKMVAHNCIEDIHDFTSTEINTRKIKIKMSNPYFRMWIDRSKPGEHPAADCNMIMEVSEPADLKYTAEIYALPPSLRDSPSANATQTHGSGDGKTNGAPPESEETKLINLLEHTKITKHGPECEGLPAFVLNMVPIQTPAKDDKGWYVVPLRQDGSDAGPSWDEGVSYFVVMVVTQNFGKRRMVHRIKTLDGAVNENQ